MPRPRTGVSTAQRTDLNKTVTLESRFDEPAPQTIITLYCNSTWRYCIAHVRLESLCAFLALVNGNFCEGEIHLV